MLKSIYVVDISEIMLAAVVLSVSGMLGQASWNNNKLNKTAKQKTTATKTWHGSEIHMWCEDCCSWQEQGLQSAEGWKSHCLRQELLRSSCYQSHRHSSESWNPGQVICFQLKKKNKMTKEKTGGQYKWKRSWFHKIHILFLSQMCHLSFNVLHGRCRVAWPILVDFICTNLDISLWKRSKF